MNSRKRTRSAGPDLHTPSRPDWGWTKIKRRDTSEAIVGTLTHPQLLVLGRRDDTGRRRTVGGTTTLRSEQAGQVVGHLAPACPGHPWEGVRFAASWGARDVLDVTLVRPDAVAEISADRAVDHGGVWRHPVRFKRLRVDMGPGDVPGCGEADPSRARGL
ncbi:hypothetical protein [Streptomyces lavendulae]|uniref:hypothetical protein n=1 Tax=Streptomyces lavendulae TaxID=1914 RepID=UPI0031ECA604